MSEYFDIELMIVISICSLVALIGVVIVSIKQINVAFDAGYDSGKYAGEEGLIAAENSSYKKGYRDGSYKDVLLTSEEEQYEIQTAIDISKQIYQKICLEMSHQSEQIDQILEKLENTQKKNSIKNHVVALEKFNEGKKAAKFSLLADAERKIQDAVQPSISAIVKKVAEKKGATKKPVVKTLTTKPQAKNTPSKQKTANSSRKTVTSTQKTPAKKVKAK